MRNQWLALLLMMTMNGVGAAGGDDRMLRRGNGPEPSTLDVQRAQDIASQNILRDLYEGLVSEDARGRIVPGMAERWTVSDDGLVYTFFLRADLKWSNGVPIDADAIVAAFNRALSRDTAAPLAPMLSAIVGADAMAAGARSVSGITVIDPRSLRITLLRPAPLLKLLALPIAMPVYLPAIAEHGNAHTRPGHLVSNGAYRLVDWQPHAAITLQRNPHFHDAGKVAIEHVRFIVTEDAASELKRFQAGDLDLTETVPPGRLDRLRERFGDELRIGPYLGSFFFGINLGDAELGASADLRRALTLAIDRDILTRYITALGEQPAYGLIPPGIDGYAGAQLPAARINQEERNALARQLIDKLQASRSTPIDIEIRYNTSTAHRRLSLAVAAMWRQTLGIKVRLRNEEWKSFVQTRRDRRITQIFRGGWIGDVDDPMSFLSLFDGDQALNWSGWIDAEFVALLRKADQDGAGRMQWLQHAEQRLLDAGAIIPLYFYTSRHLVRSDVRGFEANLLDRHPTRWMRFDHTAAGTP